MWLRSLATCISVLPDVGLPKCGARLGSGRMEWLTICQGVMYDVHSGFMRPL